MFPYLFPLASPSLPPSLSHEDAILKLGRLSWDPKRNHQFENLKEKKKGLFRI